MFHVEHFVDIIKYVHMGITPQRNKRVGTPSPTDGVLAKDVLTMKIRPRAAQLQVERCRRFGRPLLENREKWRTPPVIAPTLKDKPALYFRSKWPTRQLTKGAATITAVALAVEGGVLGACR